MTITLIRSAIASLPAVGIIKLLQKHDIRVIGTDISLVSAGAALVDDIAQVPKACAENEMALIECYAELIEKYHSSSILSGPENEIHYLTKNEGVFTALGCKIFHPPFQSINTITDKYALYTALNAKINCGQYYLATGFDSQICGQEEWILKPRHGRGSQGVKVINQLNLADNKHLLNDDHLIQQKLNGQEFSVDFLCDAEGHLLNCIPRKRAQVDSGISVIASTVVNPELIHLVKIMCAHIPLRGFNCVQFIAHQGDYILTDFNPRIGGGSILSFQASPSLEENFINLLKSKPVTANLQDHSYKPLSMLRYYAEHYQAD